MGGKFKLLLFKRNIGQTKNKIRGEKGDKGPGSIRLYKKLTTFIQSWDNRVPDEGRPVSVVELPARKSVAVIYDVRREKESTGTIGGIQERNVQWDFFKVAVALSSRLCHLLEHPRWDRAE